MKKFIIYVVCMCICGQICLAQEFQLSKELSTYRDYCLTVREGVEKKDVKLLENSIKDWNGKDDQVGFNGIQLSLVEFDRFVVLDSTGESNLKGHLLFYPKCVDSLIVYDASLENYSIEKPEILRGGGGYDCKIIHRALLPGGKAVYSSKGSGQREILVVTENGGAINLYVEDLKNGVKVSDVSVEGKPAAWVCWKMERFGVYTMTIENKSAKTISFVIASN